MVNKIIRIIVAVIVGALLWWAIQLLLVAIHAPAIVSTFVMVLGICLIAWFIWYEFGGGGPRAP